MRRQMALRLAPVLGIVLSLATLGLGMAVYGCGEGGDMAIVDIMPKQGSMSGEQPIQIKGANFRTDVGYTIYFGTKRTDQVTILDDQTLLVLSPMRDTPGPVDVQIIADNGPAFRLPQAFRYEEGTGGPEGPGKATKLNF